MKIEWQIHPGTKTAHAFIVDSKAGEMSLCKRESRHNGKLESIPSVFPCRLCAKKISAILQRK